MEPFRVLQHVQHKSHFLSSQLLFDSLERMLHTGPKIDLLGRSPARDVTVELGDGLNLLDPRVDVGLEFVEE